MNKEVDARCPVCKQWRRIAVDQLGEEMACPNCRQTVRLVPRSSRARAWRMTVKAVLLLGVIGLAFWFYEWRVRQATSALSGFELPDNPRGLHGR